MAITIIQNVDFLNFNRYNTSLHSGLEEQYLDRLITCRRPCKSGTRNNQMEEFESKSELPDNTLVSEIEPIEEGGISVQSREDLRYFVEAPLLEACQLLFDKGVKTAFSSANRKDIGRSGYIAIEYDSLTDTNKEIGKRLGTEGKIHGSIPKKGIYLEIPISETSTLGEIKAKALELANQFEDQ